MRREAPTAMGGGGSDEGGGDSGGLSVVVLNKNITVEKREGGKYLGRPAKIAREQIKKKEMDIVS